jgi:hypothetical protein
MNERNTARPRFAYVGCFTTEKRKARGKGIAVFRVDAATGAWTFVDACDAIPNPHYVCLDRTQRFLYSAHGDSSEIGAYAVDPQSGRLTFLNKQPTGGNNSSTVAVRGEREQPHDRGIRCESRHRQAHPDRTGDRNRKSLMHRFQNTVMSRPIGRK